MDDKQLEILAIELIKKAADKDLTGPQKADFVYNALADLDNAIPVIGLIPDQLEVEVMKDLVEEAKPHLKEFIEKCYQKIKHLFKH